MILDVLRMITFWFFFLGFGALILYSMEKIYLWIFNKLSRISVGKESLLDLCENTLRSRKFNIKSRRWRLIGRPSVFIGFLICKVTTAVVLSMAIVSFPISHFESQHEEHGRRAEERAWRAMNSARGRSVVEKYLGGVVNYDESVGRFKFVDQVGSIHKEPACCIPYFWSSPDDELPWLMTSRVTSLNSLDEVNLRLSLLGDQQRPSERLIISAHGDSGTLRGFPSSPFRATPGAVPRSARESPISVWTIEKFLDHIDKNRPLIVHENQIKQLLLFLIHAEDHFGRVELFACHIARGKEGSKLIGYLEGLTVEGIPETFAGAASAQAPQRRFAGPQSYCSLAFVGTGAPLIRFPVLAVWALPPELFFR